MRVTADHVVPLVEVVITMSLAVQPDRKRQSCQTTYTLPEASISAEGNGPDRSPPATVCTLIDAIVEVLLQLAPPLVERNTRSAVSLALSIGTMTVPLGCTTGCPPRPVALLAVFLAGPQVSPPSEEVLILIR